MGDTCTLLLSLHLVSHLFFSWASGEAVDIKPSWGKIGLVFSVSCLALCTCSLSGQVGGITQGKRTSLLCLSSSACIVDLCKLNVFMTWLLCTAVKFQLIWSLKSYTTWYPICKLLPKIQAQVSFVYDSWTKRSKWSKMFYNSCFLGT